MAALTRRVVTFLGLTLACVPDPASSSATASTSTSTDLSTATDASTSTTSTTTTTTTTSTTDTSDASTAMTGESESSSTGDGCVKAVYVDEDHDSYGGEVMVEIPCDEPLADGLSEVGGDCEDGSSVIHPGALDPCDGFDNNCDGLEADATEQVEPCYIAAIGQLCDRSAYGGHVYYLCRGPEDPYDVPIAAQVQPVCAKLALAAPASAYHAQISDADEGAFIADFLKSVGLSATIGLRDVVGDNKIEDYRWIVDEAPVGPYGGTPGVVPWALSQPSLAGKRWTLVEMANGKWYDVSQMTSASYLCEAEPAG